MFLFSYIFSRNIFHVYRRGRCNNKNKCTDIYWNVFTSRYLVSYRIAGLYERLVIPIKGQIFIFLFHPTLMSIISFNYALKEEK